MRKLIQKIKCRLRKHDWNAPYVLQELESFLEVYQKCLACPRARHFRVARFKYFTEREDFVLPWYPLYDNDPCMEGFLNHYREQNLI